MADRPHPIEYALAALMGGAVCACAIVAARSTWLMLLEMMQ